MKISVDHTDPISKYRYIIDIGSHAPAKYYKGIGRSYPRETYGLVRIFKDGINKFWREASVIKHADDKDNPKFAARLVVKKLLETSCYSKRLRTELWKKINKNLEEL